MSVVNVTIYKINYMYNIEIVKYEGSGKPLVWQGRNINDGYSFLIKELLILNKDVNNINFLII